MIKGKTPEEIRKLFNIVNDFTPEEEVSVSCAWHRLWLSSNSGSLYLGSDQERERESVCDLHELMLTGSVLSRNGLRIGERPPHHIVPFFV